MELMNINKYLSFGDVVYSIILSENAYLYKEYHIKEDFYTLESINNGLTLAL
ncbi:hypothetical protein H8356DRAFT_1328659 [Neocallimastix lanati (nom. inval.)]|nr:hypothetical protein H8356DRAFT_1328659 [Neocallimastix sp. JGI-2020a]